MTNAEKLLQGVLEELEMAVAEQTEDSTFMNNVHDASKK